MAKRKPKLADSAEVQVTSRKSRRRQARATPESEPAAQPEDAMSQCALLCQENRWREAALLMRRTSAKAKKDGKEELSASLELALQKIEYSLRRQMATAFIVAVKGVLKKEFLLDVGE